MDYVIKLAFVLLVFVYSWFFQIQNQEWDMLRSMLKDANNIAVHDASQELNETARAQGRLIIDPAEAYATFRQTLQRNLGLDDSLSPKAGSRLQTQVKIMKFVIVDDSTGVTFPLLYEDSAYGITKYIQGPSVIAVIETKHPVLIARSKVQEAIIVPAVQEYKVND
jgi:PHD/YefM family antitoxin component YafN of YafNO toxin-antitoxin module